MEIIKIIIGAVIIIFVFNLTGLESKYLAYGVGIYILLVLVYEAKKLKDKKKEMEKERKRLEIKSRQEREEYERKIAEKESGEEDLF